MKMIEIIVGKKEVVRGFTLPWLLLSIVVGCVGIVAVIKSIIFIISQLNVLRDSM